MRYNNDYGDGFQDITRKDIKKNTEEIIKEEPVIDISLDDEDEEYFIMNFEEPEETSNSKESPFSYYDDNVKSGKYYVKEAPKNKIITYLFFSVFLLYMEMVLKVACSLNVTKTLVLTILFSVSFGLLLTALCTLFRRQKANRRLARFLVFFITVIFILQFVSYKMYGMFMGFGQNYMGQVAKTNDSFNLLQNVFVSNYIIVFLFCIPFVLLCLLSRKILVYAKTNFLSKIICILISAVIIIASIYVLNIKYKEEIKDYSSVAFYEDKGINMEVEEFGLLFGQGIDVYKKIFPFDPSNK